MAYAKTNWQAREGEGLNRFLKQGESPSEVTLVNQPTSISNPGTPFSTSNMNKIEEGIYAAHKLAAFTYVVDSDAALAAWATDAPGNDYSRVLIKAGNWVYAAPQTSGGADGNPLAAIDISNGRTKSVVGEAGSKIVINANTTDALYLAGIKGNVTGTYPDLVDPGKDYFFDNIAVEVSRTTWSDRVFYSYYFYACSNLTNCTGKGTDVGIGGNGHGFYACTNLTNCTGTGAGASNGSYGFNNCTNLANCTGTGTGTNSYGFYACRTGFGCRNGSTASTAGTFTQCYMEQSSGTTPWANTAVGGYNLP